MKHKGGGETNCYWYAWDNPQRLGEEAEKIGNQRMKQSHPKYHFIKSNQNTEKSPGDFHRLAVTQTLEKGHPLMLE